MGIRALLILAQSHNTQSHNIQSHNIQSHNIQAHNSLFVRI
jgi:hypothetical protein